MARVCNCVLLPTCSIGRVDPIRMDVDPFTWTFVRGEDDGEQLTIVRVVEDDESARITVTTQGSSRSFEFGNSDAATRFQANMEEFLLKTGWSFVRFSPERRTGTDRRTFPRLHERRRWWTDGMITVKRFLDWHDAEDERRPAEDRQDQK